MITPRLLLALLILTGCAASKTPDEQKADDQLRMELYKGKAYLERGKEEQALAALRKAADLDPDNPQVWADMAAAYERGGQYGAALSALTRAFRLSPDNVTIQFDYGVALLRNGRMEEGEKMLHAVLPKAPPKLKADIYFNLALIMEKQGQEKEMLANLDECLINRPNHAPALLKLADYHHQANRPEREQEYLQLALMERSNDINLLERMANLLIQNGRTTQAVPLMQRIVNLAPDSPAGMRAERKLQLLQGNAATAVPGRK